jgi:hypothetical protein
LTLLMEGLNDALKAKTYSDIRPVTERMKAFLREVEKIANCSIWGSEDKPTEWECPCDTQIKELEDITLNNNRTRALVEKFEPLIDVCVQSEPRRIKWKHAVSMYRSAMVLLRKKDEITDEQIYEFQEKIDLFFHEWMFLTGRPGMTNYFHMLSSGHISEYLFYYRNLYEHSQQGWEAFNAFLKVFFFRQTGRGGGKGDKSRVRPIAKWLSRRMIWMLGTDYDEILEAVCQHEQTVQGNKDDGDDDDEDHFIHSDVPIAVNE